MPDPEFSDMVMLAAEINKEVVGIANARKAHLLVHYYSER
jgi:hypothetical protein